MARKVENLSAWQEKVSDMKLVKPFDFVKENQRNLMKKPAQAAALAAPEALPATNVTDGSFMANWNTVDGVSGYMPEVYRTFKTEEEAQFLALYEDFPGLQASDATWSDYIDSYTYRWDWALDGGKLGDQSVIFPKDAELVALYTPYMDFSHGNGSLWLGLDMNGAVGDTIAVMIAYYDYNQQSTQAVAAYMLELKEEGLSFYGFQDLDLGLSDSYVLTIITFSDFANSSDITLNEVMVLQDIEAGSEFTITHDYRTTNGTSANFYMVERDTETPGVSDNFSYGVYSYTALGGYIQDLSECSNLVSVTGTSAVEGVQVSNDKIFVHDNLHVVLEQPAQVDVYNMAGVLVMSVEGVEGENEIALPASGAYIVKAGNTVAKVMK